MVKNQNNKGTLLSKSSRKESTFIFLIVRHLAEIWSFSCWQILKCCFYKMKKPPIIPITWYLVISRIYIFLQNLYIPWYLLLRKPTVWLKLNFTKLDQVIKANQRAQKCRLWKCPSDILACSHIANMMWSVQLWCKNEIPF